MWCDVVWSCRAHPCTLSLSLGRMMGLRGGGAEPEGAEAVAMEMGVSSSSLLSSEAGSK